MLGRIELKQPVQGIPIASTVLSKYPLSWSEDNNIVLATQLGACIFELHISPHGDQVGLIFDRIYLSTPEVPNPNIVTGQDLQNITRPLPRKQQHEIFLDATLTAAHRAVIELPNRRPNAQGGVIGPGGDGNHSGFIKAVWSHRGATGGDRCFLCLVTYDHQIKIVYQLGSRWKEVGDISALWYYFCCNKGKVVLNQYKTSVGPYKHERFIAETKFLAVADIAWTNVIEINSRNPFSILLLATASSHLGLVRIPSYAKNDFKPAVISCFSLDGTLGKVNALHWFQWKEKEGFLSVGTVKGNLEIYFLSFIEEKPSLVRLMKFDNFLPGMSVNFVTLVCVDTNRMIYSLFVAAHNVFLAHLITLSTTEVRLMASTHCFLGCLAISGMKAIDSTLVYASIKDGKIQMVEVEYDLEAPSVAFPKKEVIHSSEGVLYNGFCFSPNNAFFAILECVSVAYDHLLLREPSMISLFLVNNFKTIMNYLENSEPQRLSEQVDIFESLRLLMYREENPSFPKLLPKDIDGFSSHMKRIHLWIAFIQLKSLPPKDESKEEKEELIKKLEESILVDYIQEVFSSCSEESFPSDPLHQHSLLLMTRFLQLVHKTHPFAKRIKSQLKKVNVKEDERCLVCQAEVEFTSIKIAKCPQGHSMPRCLRSLVPTVPVLKCNHCSLFYHPLAVQWYGERATACLLCSKKLNSRVSRELR